MKSVILRAKLRLTSSSKFLNANKLLLLRVPSIQRNNVLKSAAFSNAPAIALYKGFGFEELGLRKNYYSDGEDAVTMVRR